MNELAIIVLAFNEVRSLEVTIEEVVYLVKNIKTEVIIATSLRATPQCITKALQLEGRFDNVRVYFQNEPYVAAAVLESFQTLNSKYFIYMSADKETPAALIPHLLDKIKRTESDIVCASRWIAKNSFSDYGRIKYIVSLSAQKLCKLLYRSKLSEFTYGYRIYRSELFQKLIFKEKKHPFFLESLLIPIRLKCKIVEIPVHWEARDEAESVVNLPTLFSYIRPVLRILFVRPENLVT